MDAFILAAGLGTRLRPLTDDRPKALVEVGGRTLLERVARRLVEAGADRLVVNVHHHAAMIERLLAERGGFGVPFEISREPDRPLETGGALRAAAPLLRREEPFFLHNVDVLSDVPLAAMHARHCEARPLATVAVMQRPTTRHLRFDDAGLLGRDDESRDLVLDARVASGPVQALGFAGIHVIEPRFLDLLTESGAFSILDPYVRLAAAGERIDPYRVDDCWWMDLGRVEHLEAARQHFEGAGPR